MKSFHFRIDGRCWRRRLSPACFQGQQVEVESGPFFKGQVGSVGQLTDVDLLEVEPAEITVDDPVLGLFFDSDIA